LRGGQLALSGKTPFEVIYEREIISLRHYKDDSIEVPEKPRTPLVIVPPLAANMLIFDLFPTRSLVRYFLSQGFEVYLIDWGTPSLHQAKYNLGTYVKIFMPDFIRKFVNIADNNNYHCMVGVSVELSPLLYLII
jgi:polyhydroxyalkanoate synthase